jgi:hypothetical protein
MERHFLNMETHFPDILRGFPQFSQEMSEQYLGLGHANSVFTLSSIFLADNHIIECCVISAAGRDISVGIKTRLRVRSSNHGQRRVIHLQRRPNRCLVPSSIHFNAYLFSLPGIKWGEHDADRSSPSIAEAEVV